jgi:high-affinity Fe2+/Pb2+ permease
MTNDMINFIEALFGVAIACSVAAVICAAMKRMAMAKRFGLAALGTGVAAVVLELYVRYTA